MVKVGNISLETTIQMILRDKGSLTKKQVHSYLKKIEITDMEFKKAWDFCENWGTISCDDRVVEDGREVWTYITRDDYNSMGWFDKFIPKMWDILLDDSMHSTITTIRVTHRHRDQNKILEAIQQIPIVMYAEDVDDESDE
jgi:CheY-like chemotaxis protein